MELFSVKLIEQAMIRIAPWVHRTPVLTSVSLDRSAGLDLFFKAENFQKTGSFKARGASNAVFRLLEQSKVKNVAVPGIVTHSSGNHGQAVAYAAKCAGLPCCVVVPSDTPDIKCQAIQGYEAELVHCYPSPTGRKETAAQIEQDKRYHLVHPFDDYAVMAGQGTIALELLQQVPDLDAILVPIGGGGMIAGIAVAVKAIKPECKVYAVEPIGKDLGPCLAAKARGWPDPPQFLHTIADSIRTQQTGHLTFPILCSLVESGVFTVSDHQMLEGMSLALTRMKVVVEAASGAAVFAAVHQLKEVDQSVKRAGVILCGGNTGFTPLPQMKLDNNGLLPEAQ
ncbi:Tryptophan synthase beta subunit-like PLP-dependent enzyme [Trinorchestia longiramus]|nr:Tryptophan synthase beta subunit-like PLP-dependent enzyme [Trinorchestia longiramus]